MSTETLPTEQGVDRDPWTRDERTWALARLLIECRDALPAITVTQLRLHNISPTLCDRIDQALEPWLSDSPDAI